MNINVEIVHDSVSPAGKRLTTFRTVMPMHAWVHLLTHRMLSRNLSSARALPLHKTIARATYEPLVYGENGKGMSPSSELNDIRKTIAKWIWRSSARTARMHAWLLSMVGLHKEYANRPLTPYMYVEGLVSATEWDNFYDLRLDKHAQADIREVARQMKSLQDLNHPVERVLHIPFISKTDEQNLWEVYQRTGNDHNQILRALIISAARCARVSYLGHLKATSESSDLRLGNRLLRNQHMSPFEHSAIAANYPTVRIGNFYGWRQARHMPLKEVKK